MILNLVNQTGMLQPIMLEAIRWHKKGSFDKAERLYKKVLTIDPDHGDALHLLGLVYTAVNQNEKAEINLEKAAVLYPDNPLFLFDLGVFKLKMGDNEAAEKYLKNTLALQHDHFRALLYLGDISRKKGDYLQAANYYKQAVSIKKDFIPALCNLGTTYIELTRYTEAIECYEKTIDIAPKQAEAYNNLGLIYAKTGDIEKALSYYKKAHQLNPGQHLIYSNILMYSHYLTTISNDDMFYLHKQFQEEYRKLLTEEPPPPAKCVSNRKLRIGYISADFRVHSVGYFIEPIIAAHDKNEFEIFCYSDTPVPDETTARIKDSASVWRPINGIDTDTVFSMVKDDRIDILVDLAGHTENNRLPLFMKKPAPVQITYLGYPDTTGLTSIDYRLTDACADPEGSERFYTEKLIRLENCFLCYRPPDVLPALSDTPGLKNGYITFGSFNNLPKINNVTINVWSDLLNRLPDSKLYLKTKPFDDLHIRKKYTQLFHDHGISSDRLILKGHNYTTERHLIEYNSVDIALDTFPYNGTTTTFEALLMGVPVVSLAGTCHAGRVGRSILSALGMTDLVSQNHEEYIDIALNLAKDITALNNIHLQLRENLLSSVLCDAVTFTKNLEAIYKKLMQNT